MKVPPNRPGVLSKFRKCPDDVRSYFEHFVSLTKNYPWDVVIAYLFSRVELAQNMTIYCGCVKCHKVDADLTWTAIENEHITRSRFQELYASIFGKPIPKSIVSKLKHAEQVRDKIMHGKPVTEAGMRKAVMDILEYAEVFNARVQRVARFRPFGTLRGFKGAGRSLDESTSRWVLKGIGFSAFR